MTWSVGLVATLVLGLSTGAQAVQGVQPTPKTGNTHQPTTATRTDSLPLRLGSQGPSVRALHNQLGWLGFDVDWKERLTGRVGESTVAAVRAMQTKYFWRYSTRIDAPLSRRIDSMAGRIDRLPAQCTAAGVHICADKTQKVIRWVEDGKVKITTDVRFGVADGVHDTPEGDFNVYYRSRDAMSRINCIPKPYDGCMTPMPFALFFSGDMALHFSPTFNRYGYYPGGGSHGCINVRSKQDAEWIYNNSAEGTPVHIYSS